jgi:hypothetical protein
MKNFTISITVLAILLAAIAVGLWARYKTYAADRRRYGNQGR